MTDTLTAERLEDYLRKIGVSVTVISDPAGTPYSVAEKVTIPSGPLRGRICDVALQRINTVPYTVPAGIHTRPALVPMSPGPPIGTQPSPLGPDWQYWSRRYDRAPTEQGIWAHILGILTKAQP